MLVTLDPRERLMLSLILPKTGNATQLRAVRGLRARAMMSDEERESLGLEKGKGLVDIKNEQLPPVPFELNRFERKVIVKAAKALMVALSDAETLTEDHLTFFEKVLPDYGEFLAEIERKERVRMDEAETATATETQDEDKET